jgi:hypothetical protein
MKTKTKHTAEPWDARDDDGTGTVPCVLAKQVTAAGNFYVAQCNVFADAQRIVACVNALAGVEDPEKTVADMRAALGDLLWEVMHDKKPSADLVASSFQAFNRARGLEPGGRGGAE